MKIRLRQLKVRTRQTTELVELSPVVTFFHGPVSTGKSTIARLIDYCLGGALERTPAIRQEFVAAELLATVGSFEVQFERGANEGSSVRVTWSDGAQQMGSVNAPLDAGDAPILGDDVFNLSDLIFKLAGTQPIKVRRSKYDPDSPMVRLSFRDLMWYCYLRQDHLDSSFFSLEDPFKRLKSQDAMRFVTGLHSERMSDLEAALARAIDEQRTKRESVIQIRAFMARFRMGSELDLVEQTNQVQAELQVATDRRTTLERARSSSTHVVEPLRQQLRQLSAQVDEVRSALADLDIKSQQREGLRAELISAKVKAARAGQAGRLLQGVEFAQCPQCGNDLTHRPEAQGTCRLCGHLERAETELPSIEVEALRRDLNERIDELSDALARQKRDKAKQERALTRLLDQKRALDEELASELAQYDSAYVASVRAADRDVARLQERLASLERLRELPQAIAELETEAGRLQGDIDRLRTALADERGRLRAADTRVRRIAETFHRIMLDIGFPGVSEDDEVVLDPRNWQPYVRHGDQSWTFYDAGSGGKKTLFNVCYALAVHTVAAQEDLPLPSFLIIDSPTKNISDDENPELVAALYREIFALASRDGRALQFILIDSDLVLPTTTVPDFRHQRLAGEPDAPCLIPYYTGP